MFHYKFIEFHFSLTRRRNGMSVELIKDVILRKSYLFGKMKIIVCCNIARLVFYNLNKKLVSHRICN